MAPGCGGANDLPNFWWRLETLPPHRKSEVSTCCRGHSKFDEDTSIIDPQGYGNRINREVIWFILIEWRGPSSPPHVLSNTRPKSQMASLVCHRRKRNKWNSVILDAFIHTLSSLLPSMMHAGVFLNRVSSLDSISRIQILKCSPISKSISHIRLTLKIPMSLIYLFLSLFPELPLYKKGNYLKFSDK